MPFNPYTNSGPVTAGVLGLGPCGVPTSSSIDGYYSFPSPGLTCSPPELKVLVFVITGSLASRHCPELISCLGCHQLPRPPTPHPLSQESPSLFPGAMAQDSGHCHSLVLLLCSSGAREAEGCCAAQHVTVLQPQKGVRQRDAEQGLPG